MPRRKRRSLPPASGLGIGIHYDPDAFGRFSEGIARLLGTGKFLAIQTVIVVVWIAVNASAAARRWDPYPFILLNLAFSTQAAYAAPLILLAQNRQDDRDRAQAELDRDVYARTQADTEFLARELAAVRLGLANVVTGDELRAAVDRVGRSLDQISDRLDAARVADAARRQGPPGRSAPQPTTGCSSPTDRRAGRASVGPQSTSWPATRGSRVSSGCSASRRSSQ